MDGLSNQMVNYSLPKNALIDDLWEVNNRYVTQDKTIIHFP
jgi:hypothetical protein